MPIRSQGISLKPEGFKLYSAAGGIYTGSVGSVLSTGGITVTEISNTLTELAGSGFDDENYNGGYLMESDDGDAENGYIGIVAFGGQGTMGGGSSRSDILGQSIGKGFNDHSDWVIDGGKKKIVCFQMYYSGGTAYPLNTAGITAVQNCIAWMQANYTLAGGKVIIAASSQGGNILRWLTGDYGVTGLTDAAYVRANIIGGYNAAAELPNDSPDLTGLTIINPHGEDDAVVSYGFNVTRASQINAASTGTVVTIHNVPSVAHTTYTWGDPFTVNRSDTRVSNDYDGFLTYLKTMFPIT